MMQTTTRLDQTRDMFPDREVWDILVAGPNTPSREGTIINVHPDTICAGRPCVLHAPSDHHMREWPAVYIQAQWLTVRLCEHGVRHPDPDDLAWHMSAGHGHTAEHDCDGCCIPSA